VRVLLAAVVVHAAAAVARALVAQVERVVLLGEHQRALVRHQAGVPALRPPLAAVGLEPVDQHRTGVQARQLSQ
jgi:hypothetical protein